MRHLLAAVVALCACAALAGTVREFPTGEGTLLRVELADSWKETKAREAPIAITATTPDRFVILLTPVPGSAADDARMRRVLEETAKGMAAGSVEKSMPLQDLAGAQAKGYYFKATDAAPKPGEFKILYQGLAMYGKSLVMFTILFNPESVADGNAALAAVRDATVVEAPPTANAAGEVVIAFPGANDALMLPGTKWIFGGERTNKDGTAIYRAYHDGPTNFSVFIEREHVCHSAAECLDAAMKNPQYAKAADLRKSIAGPFAAATFYLDKPLGMPVSQAHAQASALVNGYWYDVHISRTAGSRPDMEPVLVLLRSLRIGSPDARP